MCDQPHQQPTPTPASAQQAHLHDHHPLMPGLVEMELSQGYRLGLEGCPANVIGSSIGCVTTMQEGTETHSHLRDQVLPRLIQVRTH
jgi:hypothetical protein